jgi:hypothetical protein
MLGDDVEITVLAPLDREWALPVAPGSERRITVRAVGPMIVGNQQVQGFFDSPLFKQRFGALQSRQVKRSHIVDGEEELHWRH